MSLLLDTHALIWFIEGDSKLLSKIRLVIENFNNKRFISIASLWEITIKASIGKIEFAKSSNEIKELLYTNDIQLIDIKIDLKRFTPTPSRPIRPPAYSPGSFQKLIHHLCRPAFYTLRSQYHLAINLLTNS